MPRPRKNPGDVFSYSELALALNGTKRTFQHLAEASAASGKLIPAGRGTRALKRTAEIGALMTGGAPVLVAARIAEVVLLEFNQVDGEVPTGLNFLARKLPNYEMARLPVDINDYWYHQSLFRCGPEIYPRGESMSSDAIIEIIDRRYLFLSGILRKPADFVGWIEGWERGAEARVIHVTEKVGLMDDEKNPHWRSTLDKLNARAQHANTNAVGKLAVNVSLAIRNALDRIAEHRLGGQ
jgi:hypothetical protein